MKYNQIYFSFYTLCNVLILNNLLCLCFSVYLRNKMLIMLLLSLSHLIFKVVATTSLLLKEITLKSLLYFLDILTITTIFV
jgi:hypothetical protein